ncbi:MAG: hypothetical protein AAFV78_02750 [Bacteroidota bacterium]
MKKILGLGVLFIGAAVIGKQVYDSFTADDADSEALPDQAGKELNERLKQGERLSYTPSTYEALASRIYEAVKYYGWDDSESKAEAALKQMKNTADILYLIRIYGRRQLYVIAWAGIPDGRPLNLAETVTDEFSQSRINRVNAYFQQQGIQFQF